MALDFGLKRMGVAVSDPLQLMAHARETLQYRSQRELFARLKHLVASEGVGLIVVGLPRNMNGSEGEMSQTVRVFMAQLESQLHVPVTAWDERLTSRQAERMLSENAGRRRRQLGEIDRVAAVLILQSYLDSVAAKKNAQGANGRDQ